MRRCAILQPYFYPYAGYFELIASVDVCIWYTDAQYIRRGWVNRNRIRSSGGGSRYLTVPVAKAPLRTPIYAMNTSEDERWKELHLKTLATVYGRRALDHPLYQNYREALAGAPSRKLLDLLRPTLEFTCGHLGIETIFADSREASPSGRAGQGRIIEICRHFGCQIYTNPSGGRHLYNQAEFAAAGIELQFAETTARVNKLSILDLCLGDGLVSL